MRKLIVLGTFLFALSAYGQDTAWEKKKIDGDVTLLIPPLAESSDTSVDDGTSKAEFRTYVTSTDNSAITVVVTPNGTKMNVTDKATRKEALDGFAKGVQNSARKRGYNCKATDTTIDGLAAKSFLYVDENLKTQAFIYGFLLNDKIYMISMIPLLDETLDNTRQELNRILSSVKINHADIKEEKFNSRTESIVNKIGSRFGWLIIAAAIGAIVYAVIRFFKKRNTA